MEWVTAEMVATVLEVLVAPGDVVALGDTLVLLDSMKMEIPVLAPWAGVVGELAVRVGEVVQAGDPIVGMSSAVR